MSDPATHVSMAASAISAVIGAISGFIGFAFDVPAPAIFAAFVGSCFGVAFSEAVTYKRAVWMLIGGTFAAGFMVTMFIHKFGDYPPRGVAALLAFVFIRYHKKILQIIEYRLDIFGGKKGTSDDESLN